MRSARCCLVMTYHMLRPLRLCHREYIADKQSSSLSMLLLPLTAIASKEGCTRTGAAEICAQSTELLSGVEQLADGIDQHHITLRKSKIELS